MPVSAKSVELRPTPPFDFAKTLRFIERFSPAEGEQRIVDDVLTKAFNVRGVAVVARISGHGSVERPRVNVDLFGKRRLGEDIIVSVRERIAHYLSLDDDLLPFYELTRLDPVMAPFVQRAYGFHQVCFPTAFENAVWAILGQRAPQRVARRAKDRVTERFGVALEIDEVIYRAFPDACTLAKSAEDALADAVRNARKLPYVRAAAHAFAGVDECWLREAPYDEVRAWLLAIDGIGEWSAAFVLTRGIGRMDRIEPVGPIIQAAADAYQRSGLTARDFASLAARYGDQQGYWAFYLRAVGEFETMN